MDTPAPTVLLVEDDPAVRRVAGRALVRAGLSVVEARDGFEALELASGQVDLVVADLVMPRMDGHELVRRLRLRRPKLPALLISGYGGDGEHVLAKPFDASELATRVLLLLARV